MTDQEAAAEYRKYLQEMWDVSLYGTRPPPAYVQTGTRTTPVTESDDDSE